MEINIKYFLESKKPVNAERALRHHLKINDLNYEVGKVEPYLDKGCVCMCTFQVQATTWQALVYEVIRECQNFGCGWCISSRIDEELCLTTSRFHGGSGVTFADVYVDRKQIDLSR